jgi:hypothetical protein
MPVNADKPNSPFSDLSSLKGFEIGTAGKVGEYVLLLEYVTHPGKPNSQTILMNLLIRYEMAAKLGRRLVEIGVDPDVPS